MHIHTHHVLQGKVHQFIPRQPLLRQQAQRGEEKRAGATGGVQQALVGAIADLAQRQFGQPVGRVQLAQFVPCLWLDKVLIELLEQILVDLAEVIDGETGRNLREGGQRAALHLRRQHPRKEIFLADVADSQHLEALPIEDIFDVAGRLSR